MLDRLILAGSSSSRSSPTEDAQRTNRWILADQSRLLSAPLYFSGELTWQTFAPRLLTVVPRTLREGAVGIEVVFGEPAVLEVALCEEAACEA